MAEWETEKQKIDVMKIRALEYLKLAQFIFSEGGSLEIALGYKQCADMVEHIHPLMIDYSKKHMVKGD